MPYVPTECNYIQSYSIALNGVEQQTSETWISVVDTADPPSVRIYTVDEDNKGIYTVSITSHLNTTPKYVSEDAYQFVVTLEVDPCSTLEFDDKNLGPLVFEIKPGLLTAETLTFNDYTDSSG